MMGQINQAGFQSPMCMFYVYVIMEIKYFWLWFEIYVCINTQGICSIDEANCSFENEN